MRTGAEAPAQKAGVTPSGRRRPWLLYLQPFVSFVWMVPRPGVPICAVSLGAELDATHVWTDHPSVQTHSGTCLSQDAV